MELISSPGCPYVQRVITLLVLHKIPFKLTNVDLSNKPYWFLEKSPLGKVPLLILGNGQTIFESLSINEYIDECVNSAIQLRPTDALSRAQNKAWIEFGDSIMTSFMLHLAPKSTEADAQVGTEIISRKFSQFEKCAPIVGPYFNGNNISLIDIAWAPIMLRLRSYKFIFGLDFGEDIHPKLSAWLEKLFSIPELYIASAMQYEEPSILTTDPTTFLFLPEWIIFAKEKVEKRVKENFYRWHPESWIVCKAKTEKN